MILVNDIGKHKDKYKKVIDSALNRVLDSGFFVQSAEVQNLNSIFLNF